MLEASFSALTRMEIIDPSSSGLQKNYLLAHQNDFNSYIYISHQELRLIFIITQPSSVLILINTDDHVNFVVIIFQEMRAKNDRWYFTHKMGLREN
jgi:hypothetical protein